jgi:hypothetical protein
MGGFGRCEPFARSLPASREGSSAARAALQIDQTASTQPLAGSSPDPKSVTLSCPGISSPPAGRRCRQAEEGSGAGGSNEQAGSAWADGQAGRGMAGFVAAGGRRLGRAGLKACSYTVRLATKVAKPAVARRRGPTKATLEVSWGDRSFREGPPWVATAWRPANDVSDSAGLAGGFCASALCLCPERYSITTMARPVTSPRESAA